jgi:hypothetical protein
MRARVPQGRIVCHVFCSLCVNDRPDPFRRVEVRQCSDDTVLAATSRNPSLLVGYLGAVSVDRSSGYEIIGLPSTARTAPLFSLLGLRDASKNPDQCSFYLSQYSGYKQLIDSDWPLIHSLPGRHAGASWERRAKDWICSASSLTG